MSCAPLELGEPLQQKGNIAAAGHFPNKQEKRGGGFHIAFSCLSDTRVTCRQRTEVLGRCQMYYAYPLGRDLITARDILPRRFRSTNHQSSPPGAPAIKTIIEDSCRE